MRAPGFLFLKIMEFAVFYLIFLLIFVDVFLCQSDINFRFCMNNKDPKTCHLLAQRNSPVICVPVVDSVDCLLKIQADEADFGIFGGEEALLSSKFANDDVQVIGQLRHRDKQNDSFAFQSVVIVKGDFSGLADRLRGKNYCHPGFLPGQLWTDRILKDFEQTVVPSSGLNASWYPTSYRELHSLDKFFASSCRPGSWAVDELLDNKLKQQFPSLCKLCDSEGRCSYDSERDGSHKAALNCLTKGGGDIAYVALQYVQEYFGIRSGYQPQASIDEYRFLCPPDEKRILTTQQLLKPPCAWVKQPWPALVASRSKSEILRLSIPQWLNREGGGGHQKWQEAFQHLIEGTDSVLFNTSKFKTLNDYVEEGNRIPYSSQKFDKSVRLCVYGNESMHKCAWLEEAVITHGIYPRLSCVQGDSVKQCMELVHDNDADIVNIDTELGYIARKEYNLSAMMFEDGIKNGGNFKIVALLQKNTTIQKLADLKGKKACFPMYNGLAWISVNRVLKSHNLLPDVCPNVKAISQFFHSACVPRLTDHRNQDFDLNNVKNLCALCSSNSNTTQTNISCDAAVTRKYYGNLGVMKCFAEQNADVMFLDFEEILTDRNMHFLENFTILCNDEVLPAKDIRSFYSEIEEKCALSVGTKSEIVGRRNRSKIDSIDTTELLLEMDDWMGGNLYRYSNGINMYATFNGIKGVIFKETTVNLVPIHDHNYAYIESYIDLMMSSNEICSGHNSTSNAVNYHQHFKSAFLTSILTAFNFYISKV